MVDLPAIVTQYYVVASYFISGGRSNRHHIGPLLGPNPILTGQEAGNHRFRLKVLNTLSFLLQFSIYLDLSVIFN